MKVQYFKIIGSTLIVGAFLILAFGSGESKSDSSSKEKSNGVSKESSSSKDKSPAVDPTQLSELKDYLQRGSWTCTNVESGVAPFMKGATFIFANNKMTVSSGGTTVNNDYEITGIMPNVPEGSKYSALITINNNKDMLSWIDEGLMVLSWGGDKAKLRLQR